MRRLVLPALLAACGGATVTAEQAGAALADGPDLGDQMNAFSCTTCHAVDAGDERMLPGYPLVDVAFRAAWWGGYRTTLRSAIDDCLQFFMGGRPLDPGSDEARALYAYLVSLAGAGTPEQPLPARPLTVVENVIDVPRGDPRRGAEVYRLACAGCHGQVHTGRGRLRHPSLLGDDIVLPEFLDTYPDEFPGVPTDLLLVEKVRHGQFFLVGGNMPFYSREAMSDADLGALVAFLIQEQR